jgi:tetratricopeptide (TPR) repeat protein
MKPARKQFLRCAVILCFLIFAFNGVCAAQQMTPATAVPKAPTAVDPAVATWNKGEYAQALAEFQNIIKQDPDNITLHTTFVNAALGAKMKSRRFEMEQQRAQAAKEAEKAKAEAAQKPGAAPDKANVEAPTVAAARPDPRPVLSAEELAKMEKDAKAAVSALTELTQVYETWAKENPKKAVYAYGLGLLTDAKEFEKRQQYLLKAVDLDPKLTNAYSKLADLNSGFDDPAAAKYARKACDTKPDDVQLQFRYATLLWTVDPAAARKFYVEMITRNAGTKTGSDTLQQFIRATEDPDARVALIEQFRRDYPKDWSPGSGFNSDLFRAYVTADPAKGLSFAQEIFKGIEGEKVEANPRATQASEQRKGVWKSNVEYAQTLVQARSMISDKKAADALALLEKTKPPRFLEDSAQLDLLKAEAADASGDTTKAYEILAAELVKDIDENLQPAIVKYGAKLGKTAQQVDAEMWSRRMEKAEPFKDFDLVKMGGSERMKLADFRGKVVLVDFWFPT